MYEQTSAQPAFWKMAIKSFIGKRFLPPTLIPRNSAAYFIRSSYGHENLPVHKTSEHLFVEPQLVGGRVFQLLDLRGELGRQGQEIERHAPISHAFAQLIK